MKTPFRGGFFLLSILTFFQSAFSQSQISGTVLDSDHQPLPYANIFLLRSADSSFVKGAISDETGVFQIEGATGGPCVVEITMLGYEPYRSKAIDLSASTPEVDLGQITLQENTAELQTVEVTAKKPFYEQKIDRLVINVENSITSAGSSALEVLERSPGIVVNRQSNLLSIAGKNGVIVMINGKINRMPIEAVVQMLAGMPSANIEKIEIITTPPANFDAEGNAGYINIVMKVTNDQGLNGSYTFSGGYGRGEIASAGINFNFRKKGLNLYGDYSFSRDAQDQLFAIDRQVMLEGKLVRTDTRSERSPVQQNHNARLGLDLNLGPRTVLGVLVSGYDNRWSMDAINYSTISLDGVPDTLLTIVNDEINHWQHGGANLNIQHTFREEETLTFDADYLRYGNENPTHYNISYADAAGNLLRHEQTFSGKVTPLEVGVGKLDYTRRFSEKLKLETGIKGTRSHFHNNVKVAHLDNGTELIDSSLTAQYQLSESIAAAYGALDMKLDEKSDLKLGLRYEYTNSNLGSAEQPDIVDRQYGNLFPSVFLSRSFNENNSANISYSRRITRPTFNDMAPFVIFLDPYTFFSGNAALQPSISNNVKLDYRFKTALFSFEYSVEDSAIANFQVRTIEGTNQQLIAAENMKNRKTASFTLAFPIQVSKWYRMQNNLVGTWQVANTFIDGAPIQVSSKYIQAVWIHSFTLPKDFSAEVVGFYRSRALFGASVALPMGAINLGIQKKFRDNFGTLRFGIDDLLNTLRFRSEIDYPEYNLVSKANIDFSQRTYKLTYTRHFGNSKLKGARQRETGAEEERRRVN
ncbi:MAG: TonB-dependent receptor [Lewinellaceae bacterium]|nr:TonB-dependent receptor [Lewinellaceae bacterium]